MKITLKNEAGEYSVEEEAVTIMQVLPLIEQLLRAAGYNPKGVLDFVEEES